MDTKVVLVGGKRAVRVQIDEELALDYDAVVKGAEPINWSRILPSMFRKTIALGQDDAGWTRMIEHGRIGLLSHRTPLKFWKTATADSYHIQYDLDSTCDPRRCDPYVTMDQGYIDVKRTPGGIRVQTMKISAVQGIYAWLGALVAPLMGWEEQCEEFFTNQAALTDPAPFVLSESNWKPFPYQDGDVVSEW